MDVVDDGPASSMRRRAARLLEALPGCVGLSIWQVEHGVTSTVASLDRADDAYVDEVPDAAVLDAVQYVGGGPGVDAGAVAGLGDGRDPDTLVRRWPLFAAAAASRGVSASLAVPLLRARRPAGVVVIYAASTGTLDRLHAAVADRLATADAAPLEGPHDGPYDGPYGAPVRMLHSVGEPPDVGGPASRAALAHATALLEQAYGIPVARGERRLVQAASRARIPVGALVETIVEVLEG